MFVAASLCVLLAAFFDRTYADTQLFYIVFEVGVSIWARPTYCSLRSGCRRYMIFGPPDKIHVGLSVINVGYTDRPPP